MSKTVEELQADLERVSHELDALVSIRKSLVEAREALEAIERSIIGGTHEQGE
jgi:hypothetical protein